jgi:hypothetical protein
MSELRTLKEQLTKLDRVLLLLDLGHVQEAEIEAYECVEATPMDSLCYPAMVGIATLIERGKYQIAKIELEHFLNKAKANEHQVSQ